MATNTANFAYHYGGEDLSTSATVDVELTPTVTITKTASPTTATTGDVITYFVNISLSAFSGDMTGQVFSDTLPPELEYVPDSLTIDTEKVAGDISHIPLDFEPGTSHLIVYQCKVL